MREYMKERRLKRRGQIIELLGGACAQCGDIEDLQIDHKDPTTKKFKLSGKGLDGSWDCILSEVKKCQLLCKKDHGEKSRFETEAMAPHGTVTRYLKYTCRCDACKSAYAKKRKRYPSRQSNYGVSA